MLMFKDRLRLAATIISSSILVATLSAAKFSSANQTIVTPYFSFNNFNCSRTLSGLRCRHFFKIAVLFPGVDQLAHNLLSFAAYDHIDLWDILKNALISIRWIDSPINDPYFRECLAYFFYSF